MFSDVLWINHYWYLWSCRCNFVCAFTCIWHENSLKYLISGRYKFCVINQEPFYSFYATTYLHSHRGALFWLTFSCPDVNILFLPPFYIHAFSWCSKLIYSWTFRKCSFKQHTAIEPNEAQSTISVSHLFCWASVKTTYARRCSACLILLCSCSACCNRLQPTLSFRISWGLSSHWNCCARWRCQIWKLFPYPKLLSQFYSSEIT